MEEFDYKLNQNNAILISGAVKGIIEKLTKLKDCEDKNTFQKSLIYLKEKCLTGSDCLTITAAAGLFSLCSDGVVSMEEVLKDFVASIQHISNFSGVLYFLFMMMDHPTNSSMKYGLSDNQHPLIAVLNRDPKVWPLVLANIRNRRINDHEKRLVEQLKPFLLHVLYDYEMKFDENFQYNLLDLFKDDLDVAFLNKIILLSKGHLTRSARYCDYFAEVNFRMGSCVLALCVKAMLLKGVEPTEAIYLLQQYSCTAVLPSQVLTILTNCIHNIPIVQIDSILNICEDILKHKCPDTSLNTLKASLIVWKIQFTVFDENSRRSLKCIDRILHTKYKTEDAEDVLDSAQILDADLYLSQCFRPDLELSDMPRELISQIFNPLLGVIYSGDCENASRILQSLLSYCEVRPKDTFKLLPVLLYKLANSQNPQLNLSLIKALPKMAVLKENLAVVVTTLKAVAKASGIMQTLVLSAFYELFLVDSKCFPYLQEFLIKENKDDIEQYTLSQAYIIKEICRKNVGLEVFGSELTVHLSRILNKKDLHYGMAQALAFEGLKYLCRYDIVDVASAWYNLAPRFENETSTRILISICDLITEVSNLYVESQKYDKLVNDVVKKLWDFTLTTSSADVLGAAYKALGCFSVEQITTSIPEMYLGEGIVVSAVGTVPGNTWIQVLLRGNRTGLKSATDMVSCLIAKELKGYRKGVYEVSEGHGEPTSMNVSRNSITAAVANYVRINNSKWSRGTDKDVYLECLRILGKKYAKPLPPMDWNFLQELIHVPVARKYAVNILSRQVALSGTARRLLENYLVALAEKSDMTLDECNGIYENLKSLCNSIQPITLKPFIAASLQLAIHENNLDLIIDSLKAAFTDRDVSETNKNVIGEVLVYISENLDFESEMFDKMLGVLCVLPIELIDDLSCPKQYSCLTTRIVDRCLKIRLSAALVSDNPFTFLDNFIDCRALRLDIIHEEKSNISFEEWFKWSKHVFVKHRYHKKCVPWFVELMAKIQLELASSQKVDSVLFAITVFVGGICAVSGFHVFEPESDVFTFIRCFPYALSNVVSMDTFKPHIVQILEWLHDMCTNKNYIKSGQAEKYIEVFKQSLLVLRNNEAFNENYKWMKFIDL
ncbi:PREDICTED: uncharacterized protein LOC108561883 [Nicrophorus vespilloides]|uniref:Uncharacterized protein LOC108561883 n=1 Tax=Nicrophorus vespilloides TaxID=110193 RepID=A0ABM1MLN7_NICVS|nr:PREDICTED: uncharacterized protein LOC108561883 [Nicrophorus vespilloides]